MSDVAKCELCGEPMPEGEEMFNYHGYSGPCPKPHLSEKAQQISDYERGQRDILNALLALNPKAAQRLHIVSGGTDETFANHEGKLPFDVVFWVAEVADQLGIQPKDAGQ